MNRVYNHFSEVAPSQVQNNLEKIKLKRTIKAIAKWGEDNKIETNQNEDWKLI